MTRFNLPKYERKETSTVYAANEEGNNVLQVVSYPRFTVKIENMEGKALFEITENSDESSVIVFDSGEKSSETFRNKSVAIATFRKTPDISKAKTESQSFSLLDSVFYEGENRIGSVEIKQDKLIIVKEADADESLLVAILIASIKLIELTDPMDGFSLGCLCLCS